MSKEDKIKVDGMDKAISDAVGATTELLTDGMDVLREAPYFKQVQGEVISVDNAADAPL